MSPDDRTPVPAPTVVRVVAGVARRGERILLTQRPPGGEHGLLWEFPGGKLEPGETTEQALEREILEELGVEGRSGRVLATHRHEYPSGLRVEIQFVELEVASESFLLGAAVRAARWVHPAAVSPAEVLAGDRPFLAALAGESDPSPRS